MVRDIRRWLSRQRIGVLMGGKSAERIVSLKTGTAIATSLKRQGFNVHQIDAARPLPETLRKNKITFAYLALHGPGGEDGAIQGLLEWLRIPYTGSRVMPSALAMDKIAAKRLWAAAGLPTAPWRTLSRADIRRSSRSPLKLPVVVKPASQGSAVGVTIVRSARQWGKALREAFRFGGKVLVEKFLQGPEITVGILGPQALPIIEILPQHDRPFYDFHAKYAPGGSRHILPARIPASTARRATALALTACRVLGLRAVARVDLIIDRSLGPCLLEVNTIPGMTETSLLPEAARAAGIDFDTLVLQIAEYSLGS